MNGYPVLIILIITLALTELLKTARGPARPEQKILGWVFEGGRLCVVAETELGGLPERTMDLLTLGGN